MQVLRRPAWRFHPNFRNCNHKARKVETTGDKQRLYERLRDALQAEADAMQSKGVVTHGVVANVLGGAEEAEARLEALLQRKRELLGEA